MTGWCLTTSRPRPDFAARIYSERTLKPVGRFACYLRRYDGKPIAVAHRLAAQKFVASWVSVGVVAVALYE